LKEKDLLEDTGVDGRFISNRLLITGV